LKYPVYRPTDRQGRKQPPSTFGGGGNECLSKIGDGEQLNILIAGDFNHPAIDQRSWHVSGGPNCPPKHLIEALQYSYLVQHATTHSRHCQGQEPSTLDLVITNENDMVNSTEYLEHHLGTEIVAVDLQTEI